MDQFLGGRSNRPPSSLCKKDLCNRIISKIPDEIFQKYQQRFFINLSVEAIEAWFFVDKKVFQKINKKLTEQYINNKCNNILDINPEVYRSPSRIFENIVRFAIPQYRYRKHENDLCYIISRIDFSSNLDFLNGTQLQSLNRIMQHFLAILK